MKVNTISLIFLIFLTFSIVNFASQIDKKVIDLPNPAYDGGISVERALKERRSVRKYSKEEISVTEISQILWSAQGITKKIGGLRTAPSAGALYPLEIYLIAGEVEGIPKGIYKYSPQSHSIKMTQEGDNRQKLLTCCQPFVRKAPAIIVIAGVYERTALKYGKRARQYVHIEAGAAGQNIYLQSESLGIGTVFVGAFIDSRLKSLLSLPEDEYPLGVMPLGRKR